MPHVQLVDASINKAKDCLAAGMQAVEIIEVLRAGYDGISMPVIQAIVSNAVRNSKLPKWSVK